MAVYAIGDIHGCYDPLQSLIDSIKFNPSRDKLWIVGDLVNRGPKSLEVLRFVKSLGESAVTVLGNHDLYLLALEANVVKENGDSYSLKKILDAPDSNEICEWLRNRKLAHYDKSLNIIMVHAGLYPTWSWKKTMKYAGEVESVLRNDHKKLLKEMYGDYPICWSEKLSGYQRLRFIINCLTRIRVVTNNGQLNFSYKGPPTNLKKGLSPWYSAEKRVSENIRVVFGHWSQLGLKVMPKIICTDTSCAWGGKLTAVRLDSKIPKVTQVCS
tara:strand:- start:516 stop:1325 length:810 start_codon:yes stop_codon:yes gene_type:complete